MDWLLAVWRWLMARLSILRRPPIASETALPASEAFSLSETATVLAGVTQMVWTTQPGGAVDGIVFTQQPVLRARNAANQNVAQAGISVTITIQNGAGTGILSGTVTRVTDANGIITHTDLSLNAFTPPAVYTLRATPVGLPVVDSAAFTVAALPPNAFGEFEEIDTLFDEANIYRFTGTNQTVNPMDEAVPFTTQNSYGWSAQAGGATGFEFQNADTVTDATRGTVTRWRMPANHGGAGNSVWRINGPRDFETYGTSIAVTSLTHPITGGSPATDRIATVVTATAHGLVAGDGFRLQGIVSGPDNSNGVVASVLSTTSFTFVLGTSEATRTSPATGTITIQKITAPTELGVGYWIKLGSNWTCNGNIGVKHWFPQPVVGNARNTATPTSYPGQNHFITHSASPGYLTGNPTQNGTAVFLPYMGLQGGGGDTNLVGTESFPTNTWCKVQVYIRSNTGGAANGLLRIWITPDGGSKRLWYTSDTVRYWAAGQCTGFARIFKDMTYGGGVQPGPSFDQEWYLDDWLVATRAPTSSDSLPWAETFADTNWGSRFDDWNGDTIMSVGSLASFGLPALSGYSGNALRVAFTPSNVSAYLTKFIGAGLDRTDNFRASVHVYNPSSGGVTGDVRFLDVAGGRSDNRWTAYNGQSQANPNATGQEFFNSKIERAGGSLAFYTKASNVFTGSGPWFYDDQDTNTWYASTGRTLPTNAWTKLTLEIRLNSINPTTGEIHRNGWQRFLINDVAVGTWTRIQWRGTNAAGGPKLNSWGLVPFLNYTPGGTQNLYFANWQVAADTYATPNLIPTASFEAGWDGFTNGAGGNPENIGGVGSLSRSTNQAFRGTTSARYDFVPTGGSGQGAYFYGEWSGNPATIFVRTAFRLTNTIDSIWKFFRFQNIDGSPIGTAGLYLASGFDFLWDDYTPLSYDPLLGITLGAPSGTANLIPYGRDLLNEWHEIEMEITNTGTPYVRFWLDGMPIIQPDNSLDANRSPYYSWVGDQLRVDGVTAGSWRFDRVQILGTLNGPSSNAGTCNLDGISVSTVRMGPIP